MVEPTAETSSSFLYEHENDVKEFDDADSLSTNENKQMDGEMEEMNEDERQDTPSGDASLELNEELQAGYKILTDLMSHAKRAANWPFMESIEVSDPELFEVYKQRIEKPVWLKLIKQKFEQDQYTTITEFVSDFRLMLENCYRFNGPDHYISKRAQKMETMLEQKLALLPREFREKTTIDATTDQKSEAALASSGLRRRPKAHVLHDSTYLLNQLREAEYQKKREYRIRQIMARRAERTALAQEIMDWEDKVLFSGKKDQMKAMWEIPQIGLFLFLCQGPLNIGEVMHFELERCFMMSRESSTMHLIMTSLLSTPFQRLKLDRKKLMPYRVWEQKLRVKLQSWYKVLTDMNEDVEKTCYKLGIDEQFFDIVGKKNPLERKRYHEISFYRKVWIMKSLCDNCLHQQDSLRETIEIQPYEDQREYLLGTDNSGQRYVHFPQFCGADVRVYRQAPVKYPKIEIKPDPFNSKRKFPFVYKPPPMKKVKKKHKTRQSKPASENVSPMSSPQRQRPSRLRQAPKPVVPLQLLDDASITEDTGSSSSEEDSSTAEIQETDQSNRPGSSADVPDCDPEPDDQSVESDCDGEIDDQAVDRLSSGSDATLPYCDNSDTNSNFSSQDQSRESSPYPSCSDLSLRFSSQIDRSSDVSQESSPCPSPADFGLRRGTRFDRSSDTSRDASPLIFDSDFGLRRSSRNRIRLKNIPPFKAARNLSAFLLEENSASNSSITGENSLSGMGTSSLFKDDMSSRRSSKSSEMTEESNDCDINVNRLFANSRTSDSSADFSENFHNVLQGKNNNLVNSILTSNHCAAEENDEQISEKQLQNDHINALSKDEKKDSKELFKNDSNVFNNNNVDFSFSRLKDLPFEGEKSALDSNFTVDSLYGDCESLGESSSSKIENLNSKGLISENSKEVAMETEIANFGLISNTGTEKEDRSVNSGEDSSIDKSSEMIQNQERYLNDPADDDGISDRGNGLNMSEENLNKSTVDIDNSFSVNSNDAYMFSNNSSCIGLKEKENANEEVESVCEKMETKIDTVVKAEDNVQKHETSCEALAEQKLIAKEASTERVKERSEIRKESTINIKTEPAENNFSDIKPKNEDAKVKVQIETINPLDLDKKTNVKFDITQMKAESGQSIGDAIKPEKYEDIEDGIKAEGKVDDIKPKDINDEEKKLDADLKTENLEESEEDEEEMLPDSREFEMVADSVEEVRKLAEQFAEPEPIVTKRGKKEQVQRPPLRKKNIVILHERLQYLLKELEPWEAKLQQATKRARLRMRKEMEDYLLKPEEEKDDDWKSSDEETESGESDDDNKDEEEGGCRSKTKVPDDKTSASNSRCSTPVKPPEEVDEIDISHRGRLRKRRIIPNNVEDQMAVKKPKQVKSDPSQSTPTSSQPVIVQSGKTQLVDYADIIRQLKNTGGNTPILIKTTQGGRTVLTSVLPVNSNSNSDANTTTIPALQTLRIVSPSAGALSTTTGTMQPQALRISVPSSGCLPATSKALQHPTIQNLLSGTVAGSKLLPKSSPSVTITGNCQATEYFSMTLPPTPEKSQSLKVVLPNQTTPQKIVPGPVTTPRKIAPHTTASNSSGKPKAKYYAANASTLPINVVEQLIATRGAKLSQGAYNQSILLIPMENEGQSRNVVSSASVTPVKCQLSPATTPNGKTIKSESTYTVASTSAVKTSPNTLILPKPQTSPVLSLGQGIPGIQIQPAFGGLQRPQAFLQPAIVEGMNVTRLVPLGISPKSPTRYPTNETVKTLLEKRKPPEDKETLILEKRKPQAVTKASDTTNNSALNTLSDSNSSADSVVSLTTLKTQNSVPSNPDKGLMKSTNVKVNSSQPTIMTVDPVKTEALVSAVKSHQCVITSISAAKLNTLLLQTSAAGAKSIPSLIKLPSKAALDSAVKAVVTSVNITLPTVNIKVPSPTSLPSIGPRRNVTKTIQTMKSPIPVAPKFVTQSSGGQTTLSYADSHTAASSQMLTVSSSAHGSMASTSEMSVNQSQIMTGSLDQDGKRVVTRLTPQLVLTPKGVMQMGFVNTGHLAGVSQSVSQVAVPSSSVQSGNQTILIQNSAGQYQLIQQTSPVLQQAAQGASLQQLANQSVTQSQNLLQAVKPVVALNASGNPIILPTVKTNTQLASVSTPPSIVLHNSTYYSANPRKPMLNIATASSANSATFTMSQAASGSAELKSPTAGLLLQQASSSMLQTAQRPVASQSGMVSPVLGLPQGLVLQGGVQLASPLVNQLGLNLIQPGIQPVQNQSSVPVSASHSLNLLQKAGTPGPHLLNINPLLLNTALTTTTGGVLRQQLNTQLAVPSGNQVGAKIGINTIVRPSTPTLQQQLKSSLTTTTMVQPTVPSGQNGTGLVSPLPQVIQMPGSSLVIPALRSANQHLNLLGQLTATPSSAQKQLVFQYPSVGQTVTTVTTQTVPSQTAASTPRYVVSVPNKQIPNEQGKTALPVAKLQAPQRTQAKVVNSETVQSVAKKENLLTTVAVNQVTLGQKTSPTQQKLLLFSIGGQLVTGQGVPVSLSDGVLKLVPHGKIKINNQTLSPEQIKQTLAKINEAAAMTLNPTSRQQNSTQLSGSNAMVDQGKVIPLKIVKDSIKPEQGPTVASMDHSYLNSNKEKIVTSLMNGNAGVSNVSTLQLKIGSHNTSTLTGLVSPNSQTGLQVVYSDSTKVEQGQEVQVPGQSNEMQYGLKPMEYSSGYVVRQMTSDQEEIDEKPGFANQTFNIGKLVVDKEAKRFVIKAPVKNDLNGSGDASNTINNCQSDSKVKAEDEEEENDDKLVIDDGVSEKEAALNLLTLANQAPVQMVVKVTNNE